MNPFIDIEPIRIGELQEKIANAITWDIVGLQRGAKQATAMCSLIYSDGYGNTSYVSSFQVIIDEKTLNSWGEDDTVIDDAIINFSPLFIKKNIN